MRWTQLDPSGQDPGYVLAGDNPVNNGDNLLYRGPLSESSAHCATIGSMKVLILYRPDSEHGRRVEEYIHDFQSRHPAAKLETLNIDTREGSAMATVYDIVQYPAILVMRDDGTVQNIWEGDSFPLIDEVAAYSTM